MTELSSVELSLVSGGAGSAGIASGAWAQVRADAGPHCPQTVAKYTRAPKTRSAAQAIGNACLAEMGPLKAAMGGSSKINSAIDAQFPR